ncbi:hypothetical protein BV25DRAFT_1811627 [Artomyces pyxidatus]|uniref:Uncharacterized protein n=1 Tax=Artomyces pyxidatus TaxID=48021 RepID=A0ACB8SP22_9AGAM|nr:hypothetical protein BV25DRAFT_1811627 [Artomyces pyxidatus]
MLQPLDGCLCGRQAPCNVRCRECVGQELTCRHCACERHQQMPLHMMEVWNGSFFERTTLAKLDFVVQLGHPPGTICPYRYRPRKEFTIIHTNGIQRIDLCFCGCNGGSKEDQWRQLRRYGWWPATPLEPQTAATVQALKQFHLLSLQGKVTGFDYYRGLELQTDNTGLEYLPDRLSSFMNMVRQYRHTQMMKRGGRGHSVTGVRGTQAGELAVLCPACPQPGLNLADDWMNGPLDEQWLYRRIIAMDANFRLKNKLRSSDANDPGFSTGFAYFVEQDPYNEHVANYATQEEISNCSGFAAIAKANTKNTKGLRSTGVGAVSCAKHEFWMPNGLGDLQKGERYCNMDFIFWSSLRALKNTSLLVSYDIACQWSRNFWERVQEAPPGLEFRLCPDDVDFAIPKFHLPAHGASCQVPYSFNYKTGVGMTDGESPERNWAALNGAASSTKEMGPGARHDTLDDHCGHANWRRVVKTGASIVRRTKAAVANATDHVEIFEEFTLQLLGQREGQVREWVGLVERWDAGDRSENPYECSKESSTLSEERLRLAEEEAEREAAGQLDAAGPGRSAFLLLGMDIEEAQYSFTIRDGTALQAAQTQEARSALLRQIFKFRAEQEARMPDVSTHFEVDDTSFSSTPEKIKLYLPSDLPQDIRDRLCPPHYAAIEGQLRYAQASDALDELRRHLRIRTYLNNYKIKNVTGQVANTRARGLQSRVDQKVKAAAARYRRCRAAYTVLVGPGDWEARLQVLHDEDIRGLGERGVRDRELSEHERVRNWTFPERIEEGGVNPGESTRTLSWLWFAVGLELDSDDPGMHDEWAKARARAKRWHEEVIRIQHEMANITRYLAHHSTRWTALKSIRAAIDDNVHLSRRPDEALNEGLHAFASRQADMFNRMRLAFDQQWTYIRRDANAYLAVHPFVRYPNRLL